VTPEQRAPIRAASLFDAELRSPTAGILVLITLIAFEAMAVAPALPTAVRDLHGIGGYGWTFTGFLVANIVAMVIAGQLCDTRGPAVPLLAGIVAFLAGLVLSGSATTMLVFVAGRVVLGAGGGLLITACYVVIGEVYPDAVRPKLFAAISTAWVLPSLVGPVIAGAVTQDVGWRWVFGGLIPFVVLGIALLVPVLRRLHVPDSHDAALADPWRIVHAIAVAAGVAALEQAGQHPSARSIAVAAAGVAAMAWGMRTLLPAGTLRIRPGVSAPIALRGLLAGSFFGMESVIPLSLTVAHGYHATAAGLPLACSGFAWALGSWWQGREVEGDEQRRRIGLVRTGFALVAVAGVLVALSVQPSLGWVIYPAWSVAGVGAGLTMSSVGLLMLRYTNDRDRGADSAALQLSDATTSALTTGLAGVLVAAAARGALGYTAAFTGLDLAMAAIALVGALSAPRLRRPTPAD
jgi:MFS family permease